MYFLDNNSVKECRLDLLISIDSLRRERRQAVWPGSDHPAGLIILAMLTSVVCEATFPMNSSICLGGLPAA